MAGESGMVGVESMRRVFRELPTRMKKNALDATARAGAKELHRAALLSLTLAMDTRSAREEDVRIKKRREQDMRATFEVGPWIRRPQLRWLHTGTRGHLISARVKYGTRRGRLNVAVRSTGRPGGVLYSRRLDEFFGVEVDHPGQAPTYWLEVAQRRSRNAVLRAMALAYKKALAKQVKALGSKRYTEKTVGRILAGFFG